MRVKRGGSYSVGVPVGGHLNDRIGIIVSHAIVQQGIIASGVGGRRGVNVADGPAPAGVGCVGKTEEPHKTENHRRQHESSEACKNMAPSRASREGSAHNACSLSV
jgi:hypothetical protein